MVLHVVLTVLAFKNINALIIKFANTCIWPGRTLDVVVRALKVHVSFYQLITTLVSVCTYVCMCLGVLTYHAQIITCTSHTLLPCNLTLVDFGKLDGCFV